jgi:hypothetical protein
MVGHMNSSRRWHGWDTNIKSFPAAEPKPGTLDWDIWLGVTQPHDYNKDLVNGQWRCWYDFGLGALGDWGAHIFDTAHEFLDLGLPYEVSMLKADGHNPFFYPQASTILFRFPERGICLRWILPGMMALTIFHQSLQVMVYQDWIQISRRQAVEKLKMQG